ncbi:hypothetical protein BD309DRAFT_964723 [Dichomitus squalens]|uniref:Uncharacterized protein n=1 Tax=Dichomitus squalens TaxID=114155 RepID=A0A4Q9NPD9_9APHY|nr:hypothetical protein BD309DRAFT_964723 [Dichomitus squalens]TBU64295.1 hypothetical protein BD310DRAFT_944178 [Dichomitus squalens]
MDHRSTLSIPPKSDASLAEWTSKIKELQKQVDEDEEAETRRLEAEIAASRQARMRRSTNLGSRTNSVDLSQSTVAAAIRAEDQSVVSDEPLTALQKQRNQDDALRKLMGEDNSQRAPSRSRAPPYPKPVSPAPVLARRPSSPISLAAFIGGRATGPRLTKHAPQQDAHDPTQFEQRTHISAPHPIFGRGGVAMPGMTGNGKASVVSRAIREKEAESSSGSAAQRDRRTSTPTAAVSTIPLRSVAEKAQEREREIIPSYTGSSQANTIRQRTMSTPTGATPAKTSIPDETFNTKPKANPISRPLSHSPNPIIIRPITPRSSAGSRSPAPRPSSSASTYPASPSSPIPSSKQAVPLPGLARPIQPTPRHSLGSPQMPPSQNPSPAFLKPPPEKQPTPSLSRLQGRGFVKKVVEKSASLEVGSPESSPTPERSFTPSGKRQSSVLDRWQHGPGGSPTPPPVISPKPMPMRKSFTADPASPTTSSYSVPLKGDDSRPGLKSKSSMPSLPTMFTGSSIGASSSVSESGYSGPRLGSSKTVITFIQPSKTGDQPPSASPPSGPEVDELGMRVRTRTISGGLVQERGEAGLPVDAPKGQPLSHPTKDRAKKPRKGKSAPASALVSKLDSIRESSPTRNETVPLATAPHVADNERATPSLSPPQTYGPVRTVSPTSQGPAPPATKGSSDSSASKPIIPPKPSLDVDTRPVAGTPGETISVPTGPHAPPPGGRSPAITPPHSTAQKSPSSPARHSRIPSTGNRATVMDVAHAFTEALSREPSISPSPPSSVVERQAVSPPSSLGASHAAKEEEEEDYTPPSVRNMVANWGPRNTTTPPNNGTYGANNGAHGTNGSATQTIVAPPLEKRKSSYEKYSAFILPPLAEERTPVASPAGTLKSEAAPPPEAFAEDEEEWEPPAIGAQAPVEESRDELVAEASPAPEIVVVESVKPEPRAETIQLVHDDQPLPHVDVDALYRTSRPTHEPNSDVQTISVEVMAILGNSATAIGKDAHVFHDSELLAVIHRAKVKSSGLVTTKVWAWHGRRAQPDERELQKVQELARRYGTTPVPVEQAREPPEFVSVLGGTLATRQGTRAHWSPENTAMHVVRSLQGSIYIDELDLGVKNLCSGYSYCVSILETFYVWYGRGSTLAEQAAALAYAKTLAPSEENIIELPEDQSQDEEMFWMMLGDGDYANADYWKWRASAPCVDPRLWVVDDSQDDVIRSVSGFPAHAEFNRQVYLVDCIWELFVVIGSEARGRRLEIRLALSVADTLAKKASATRPFTPPVHALVFPTQIPTDLLLTFRELHESDLNAGDIPDHMNLVPAIEADANLNTTLWTSAALQDHTMLPLGVHPSDLS